ncbi:uncharacterized protein LOC118182744 [Stegodyphus dumicola]|uniref:uncharacterized protein LOC118182744 n=1 Tax=Stegodyphus dumicola TaxID=202533 RepID=UPI0015AC42D8|nr:uncharacterized protein LOC118182744 [Stegodyphus dumicola]XP_035208022.1 uncharacterized protein LOC118182744 [Stegodyphus dumicola]
MFTRPVLLIISMPVILPLCFALPTKVVTDVTFTDKAWISNHENSIERIQNRQTASNFGVSGPVAASLAFVGLNLAFISLLVPFVVTAVAVSEKRSSDDSLESLQTKWRNMRHLYRSENHDADHSSRFSKKDDERRTINRIKPANP